MKTISMLITFKVSSLACKCLFYRSEHRTKERLHGIEFWRSSNAAMKSTNRKSSKSSWEKWCHLLQSLKPHNWFIFWWQPKMSNSLGKVFVCNWMILIWSDHSWDIERKNIRKTAEPAKNTEILYFQGLASC